MSLSSAVGSFALPNPSANIVITGLGFQPKIIFFWSMAQTSGSNALGVAINSYLNRNFGAADGTNQWCQSFYEKDGETGGGFTQVACTSVYCIVHGKGNTSGPNDPYSTYSLHSMDSGGFTLYPQTAGSAPAVGTVRIFYLALGGSDITGTALGTISETGSTGSENITGLGITPACVLTALSGVSAESLYASAQNYATSCLNVGFSDGTNQATVVHMAAGQGSNNQELHYGQHNECYSGVTRTGVATPTLNNRGYIDTFVSGGFTIHRTVSVGTYSLCYAAIAGLKAHVGSFATKTDTSTHMAQTGCGFSPAAALILSPTPLSKRARQQIGPSRIQARHLLRRARPSTLSVAMRRTNNHSSPSCA
jgi:hypothetical protein